MAITFGANHGQSNGTTAVDVVPVPDTGQQRSVRSVRVYNRDTVSHGVILIYDDGGTQRYMAKATLAAGDSHQFLGAGDVEVLDVVTRKLRIVLTEAHTTSPCDFTASWMNEE